MDGQIRTARDSYESSLSVEQKALFKAVQGGDLVNRDLEIFVQRSFGKLSETMRRDKWFDYVLLTSALEKENKPVIKFLLNSGCRTKTEEKTKFLCTPLYYAVEKNYTRIVGELVKKGASIRDTDVNERSPLEYAVHTDKIDMVEAILRNRKYFLSHEKLDPNNKYDQALLQTACYKSNLVAVKELLELKFPITTRSSFSKEEWRGFTLLHFATAGPKRPIVDWLVNSGADIFAQDEKGRTPVHLAFKNEGFRSYALENSHLLSEWIRNLVDKNFSNPEDENGVSHFHILCCGCDDRDESKITNAVQYFFKNKVDVNQPVSPNDPIYSGYTALHFAVRHLRFNITKLLLEEGADLTKSDELGLTPLHVACDRSIQPWYRSSHGSKDPNLETLRQKIAKLLLDQGGNVDAQDLQGRTPIHYASSRVNPRMKRDQTTIDQSLTQILLSKSQLNTNHTDSRGLTYLHIASSCDLAAVKTLVENGAPVNSCVNADGEFKPGYSALHFAIFYGKVEIVEYLLDHGADPNLPINQDSKQTPLHLVCTFAFTETYCRNETPEDDPRNAPQSHQTHKIRIIELLLKHGALINAKDSSGNTPLSSLFVLPSYSEYEYWNISVRLYVEQRTIIQTLLENGADVHSRNNNEKSVLHMVAGESRGPSCIERKSLVRLILTKGADINAKDKEGLTPLHEAVRKSMTEKWDSSLIRFFLECGADVTANSLSVGTVLHITIRNFSYYQPNHEMILLCLLDRPEIDLNAQNSIGDTALHIAGNNLASSLTARSISEGERKQALMKHSLCIEKLLIAGADINILNINGLTPLYDLYEWLKRYSYQNNQNYLSVLLFILTQLKKLLKMNVFVNEKVKKELDELSLLRLERNLAIDTAIDGELDKLKSKKVDQYTSLYDILLKNVNDVSKHVKNEDFKKMITSTELSIEFPVFHVNLIHKYKLGSARSSILGQAKGALEDVLQVSWPDSCSEHVLKYLSNDSLKSLVKCIPDENARKRSRQSSPSGHESSAKIPRF